MKKMFCACLLLLASVGTAGADDQPTLAYSHADVARLLNESGPSVDSTPSVILGSITFYDPGHSIERMRAHPALQGKVNIHALTLKSDGQPWYVGHEFAEQTDGPRYRTVRIVQSKDPGHVLLMEGGDFAPARVCVMLYSIHMLATNGGRLTGGMQWTTTSDVAPGPKAHCPPRRVFAAYHYEGGSDGIILEPLYYGKAPCDCLFEDVGFHVDCSKVGGWNGTAAARSSDCAPCGQTVRKTEVRTTQQPTLAPPRTGCCGN